MSTGLLALFFLLRPAFADDDPRKAPAPSLAITNSALSERQNILAEMRQRKILSPDIDRWNPEDIALLLRLRRAEAAGAVERLKARGYSLKNLVVVYKRPGSSNIRLRLTREGYERYRLAQSQEALAYFEAKGVEAKWAFYLKDMQDRLVFDPRGLLTETGEDLYSRVSAGKESHWKTPSGETFGNRPPRSTPARARASSAPPHPSDPAVIPSPAPSPRSPQDEDRDEAGE